MLKRILIFTLAIWGTTAIASPEDDADLFMSHFIDQKNWDMKNPLIYRKNVRRYSEPLRKRGVTIIDQSRFEQLIPEHATEDVLQQRKSHVAEIIIESYGAENLAQIADFFRTPFGQKMLLIAKEEKLFDRQLRSSLKRGKNGPINRWRSYLSPLELAHFSTFANTPSGQVFVKQTWKVRRSVHNEFWNPSHWPAPPLDRPYIVEIMKTDGVLKFPNRIVRQSLISELSNTK
jgi:hypothetical protein